MERLDVSTVAAWSPAYRTADGGHFSSYVGQSEDGPALNEPPLVVDVDGTLLRTDLLAESCIKLLIERPLDAFKLPVWLFAGKARLKREIASRVDIDVDLLPVDEEVLYFLKAEHRRGRKIYLASASHHRYVEALAARIAICEGVFATANDINLGGTKKADVLVRAFGEKGFDYIGNSRADVPIFRAARNGYLVRTGLWNISPRPADEPKILAQRSIGLRSLIKAMRPYQWSKNLLLFVPPLLGGAIGDPVAVVKVLGSFAALSLFASCTYLLNDSLDLASDRKHPVKRKRALTNGDVPLSVGAGLAAVCLGVGIAIGSAVGLSVLMTLLGYLALTIAYSVYLKRIPIVDAATLGGLYTWRIFVGIIATGVLLSAWLLVFSFAFFFSLALTKRYAEITAYAKPDDGTKIPGRGYRPIDGPFVMSMGIASGIASILIFVLYLIEGAFRAAYFTSPQVLWIFPIVILLWLCRMWMLCTRGVLKEDPVEFAITDRKSLILGGILVVALVAALTM